LALTIEANDLAWPDHIGRTDTVSRCQGFPVPAKPKGDGIERVASLDAVLAAGDGLSLLGGRRVITIHHADTGFLATGATGQQYAYGDCGQPSEPITHADPLPNGHQAHSRPLFPTVLVNEYCAGNIQTGQPPTAQSEARRQPCDA
jgi:hypothetical protein